jgi:phosphoribosylformylglycinamidine synthase subunit PurL
MLAQPDGHRRAAAGRHRQSQFRQSRAARRSWASSSAIKGIGEACRALDFPIVSGNVSLYNETNGQAHPADPHHRRRRPDRDWSKMVRGAASRPKDERILLIGAPDRAGARISASRPICASCTAARTARRRRSISSTSGWSAISCAPDRRWRATAVHDLSDGGLAVALAEMAMASGIGARSTSPWLTDPMPIFFGEDQGRYLVTISKTRTTFARHRKRKPRTGLPRTLDRKTGGDRLNLFGANAIPVDELKAAHESGFRQFMDG